MKDDHKLPPYSIQVLNSIVDDGWTRELSKAAVNVLLVFARHANNKTKLTYPSLATISQKLNLHERNVRRAIKELLRRRWLVVNRHGGGSGRSTIYRLEIPHSCAVAAQFNKPATPETCAKTGQKPAPKPTEKVRRSGALNNWNSLNIAPPAAAGGDAATADGATGRAKPTPEESPRLPPTGLGRTLYVKRLALPAPPVRLRDVLPDVLGAPEAQP
jgi:hypothetical protein